MTKQAMSQMTGAEMLQPMSSASLPYRLAAMIGLTLITGLQAVADPASDKVLPSAAQNAFAEYQQAVPDRAFAIAPGGAWGWASDSPTMEFAEKHAISLCRQHTEQPCHIYAVNDRVVLDLEAWNTSWRLAADPEETAPDTGVHRGSVFPDIVFHSAEGRQIKLSDLRGKTVFLHFWGSWCPPCKAELPGIAALSKSLADEKNVLFILLQTREPLSRSKRWLTQQNLTLPLHDSGHQDPDDTVFRLADGSEIEDRAMARVFPTTFVLNGDGRVVFASFGPVENWKAYLSLIRNTD
ncbi:redoxin domain-containing protein [Alisedimentitalea sp. MJ-SS2]|uniref:redoxin domain-containing protein n=1 Tax=Aliisedimentitalea sp. MJ-SS2 TaxID=3049795 RepID=UPI0029102F43|nr:redoxin domain-containing protein [Alisedimentitalea sp. MJ-SS2]MDU8926278.1 redoxin domain-containing protein [Alisedimentitalea sp. MJ-SS2]